MEIKVGSRESKLAVVQSEMVMDYLEHAHKDLKTKLVTMKTTGDIILDRTLDKVGGKGLFVKELDKALEEKRVDLTVHSLKDVPMEVPEAMPLLAYSSREDERDCLILPEGVTQLDLSKPIGCSSLRRTFQLKQIYKDVKIESIRGNVQTRLSKLDSGQYSAIVLAYAGIKRLGLEHRVSKIFSVDEMIPACCQGILAVQGRADFPKALLEGYNCPKTEVVALAERSFVATLDGGCSTPVAAHCQWLNDEEIQLKGFFVDNKENIYIDVIKGSSKDAKDLGSKLAMKMKEKMGDGKIYVR